MRKLIFLLGLLFSLNHARAMIVEEELPKENTYHFIVFKNKVDLQSDENKTKIQDIFYEKEGCVLLLNPSEEDSKFLCSLYSSVSTQVEFYKGENEFFWPLTHYSAHSKGFLYWPKKVSFPNLDFLFMRNLESSNIYQHPLPLVGCYIKHEGIDKSLDNFFNSEYFKERLTLGSKYIIRQNIMKYYYNDKDLNPLIVKPTSDPIRGLWRE